MAQTCQFYFDACPGIQNTLYLELLYTPLFGEKTSSVYEVMAAAAFNQTSLSMDELLDLLQLNEAALSNYRKILEQYRLLVTWKSKDGNRIEFHLQPALDAQSFLKHEIFGRIFFERMGEYGARRILNLFAVKTPDEDMENVSSLDMDSLQDLKWSAAREKSFQNFIPKHRRAEKYPFDWNLFYKNMDRVFPQTFRTEENEDRISYLANLYGMPVDDMRIYSRRAYNKKTGVFDFDALVNMLNRSTKSQMDRSVEQSSPILYLQSTLPQNTKLPLKSREAISEVCLNYPFSDEVVIELIKYTLYMTGGAFNEKYFSKVAQTWHRKGIDTVLKAQKEMEESKNWKEQGSKEPGVKQDLPEWYDTKPEENVSEEDLKKALDLFYS